MSDLQISLLVLGALFVAGVYLFNVWQERQLRRRAEQAFAREHDDVLLQAKNARDERPAGRIEPKFQAETPKVPSSILPRIGTPAAPVCDPVIDYVVEVTIPAAADGADLRTVLLDLANSWGKPVQLAGYDPASGEWQVAGLPGGRSFSQFRVALQITNRSGCIEKDRLAAFRDTVLQWAERGLGTSKCLDVAEVHAMAAQLDRFCAEVDIAIGINVVAHDGNPFSGIKIRATAEAAGFQLAPDGVFHFRGDRGVTLFTLENHEPTPFLPEHLKTMFTNGITFLLDVPRADPVLQSFDTMLGVARNIGASLDGILVDDNRSPLSDNTIATIRRQLERILAKMEGGQVAPGGPRALRLFS